jgi:glycosyltransferase involved in cell wall biosynthesis
MLNRRQSPTTILLLGEAWFDSRPGGMNRYFRDLYVALGEWGADVQAIAFGEAPEGDPSARSCGPLGRPLPRRLLDYVRAARRTVRGGATVVDCHFALYAAPLVALGVLRRTRVVVHFHGPWAAESTVARGRHPFRNRLKRAVEQLVYCRADVIIVLSEAFRDIVVRDYGASPEKVHVVPPGVEVRRFRPTDRPAARHRFGIPNDHFAVVSVRRLDRRMGLDVLLDAWRELESRHFAGSLLIAGSGRERDDLERRRNALAYPERVQLLGRVEDEDLPELYGAADCSVVPTRALEGFGLVVLESLATGTPAIVTDVGGLPDGVRGLDPSLVLPAEDAGALANRLAAAAAGRLPSRDAALAHARTFEWARVAERHLELFGRPGGTRPRVAYVDHCAELSGGELALARLIPSLDVEPLVVLGTHGPLEERLRASDVPVRVLALPGEVAGTGRQQVRISPALLGRSASSLRYVGRLARLLRREDIDIVHTNSLKAALYGGLAGRLARKPVVWHVRDRIADDYLPRPAVRLVRALARVLPTQVIANSAATLETVGVEGHVVPSPIDTPPRHPSTAPTSPLTVALVGRIAEWKGQDLFVRAFAEAFGDRSDIDGIIVGAPLFGADDHAFLEELHHLVEELGLGARIHFAGHLDPVPYETFDILVHASRVPEPFGQVVAEGMAAGLAVIAAGAGGPAELIDDGRSGLLYPMGDAQALAATMRRTAGDPELCRSLGEAAVGAVAHLAPAAIAARVAHVYAEILEGR